MKKTSKNIDRHIEAWFTRTAKVGWLAKSVGQKKLVTPLFV
jgi:hypothetical protein